MSEVETASLNELKFIRRKGFAGTVILALMVSHNVRMRWAEHVARR
jgi:hypothetical protein